MTKIIEKIKRVGNCVGCGSDSVYAAKTMEHLLENPKFTYPNKHVYCDYCEQGYSDPEFENYNEIHRVMVEREALRDLYKRVADLEQMILGGNNGRPN